MRRENLCAKEMSGCFGRVTIAAAKIDFLELSRKLSPKKRRERVEFGRQLYAKKAKKASVVAEDGDAAWEKIIADPKPRPKLRAYVERILQEEKAEPMNLRKL